MVPFNPPGFGTSGSGSGRRFTSPSGGSFTSAGDLTPEQVARLADAGFRETGGGGRPGSGGTVRPTRPQAPKPPKPTGGSWVPGEYDTTDDGGNFGGAQGWRIPEGWNDPAPWEPPIPPTTSQPAPRQPWEFDPRNPSLPPAGEGTGPNGGLSVEDIERFREFGGGPDLPPKPKPRKPKKPTKPHRPSRGSINPRTGGGYRPH